MSEKLEASFKTWFDSQKGKPFNIPNLLRDAFESGWNERKNEEFKKSYTSGSTLYAIEFRNGGYLKNLNCPFPCQVNDAKLFSSKDEAWSVLKNNPPLQLWGAMPKEVSGHIADLSKKLELQAVGFNSLSIRVDNLESQRTDLNAHIDRLKNALELCQRYCNRDILATDTENGKSLEQVIEEALSD